MPAPTPPAVTTPSETRTPEIVTVFDVPMLNTRLLLLAVMVRLAAPGPAITMLFVIRSSPVVRVIVAGKPNAMFKKIVSTMLRDEGSPVPADPVIHPGGLLPTQRAYYHYAGSLTTPPCSETVDWIVLTHPIEVDEADIARFAKLYPMNARPVQSRDRRFILSSGRL